MTALVSLATEYKPLIDVSQALLTPVIALIAGWIAYQQVRTNRRQFQLARYDRQRKVYFTLIEFLSELLSSVVKSETLKAFHEAHSESHFIFDKNEVPVFLDAIATKSHELSALYLDYQSLATTVELENWGDNYDLIKRRIAELQIDLGQQIDVARELFKKHLKLT